MSTTKHRQQCVSKPRWNPFFGGSTRLQEIDPVLKAAIAHFWFVTIHPFEDGNGRIARAIADMALSQADETKERFYSMSSGIEAERREYYIQLESAQRGNLDITEWLHLVSRLPRSHDRRCEWRKLSFVLHKARLWQQINLNPVNDRQRKVINRMLDDFQGSPDHVEVRQAREMLERHGASGHP